MYNTYCGIDFGTTNSAISVVGKNKKPSLINFDNKETIPTAICFPEDDITNPLFGTKAIDNYINGGQGRFMRSLKRILGTDLMGLKTDVCGISMHYDEIILKFIKHLKDTAESQIDTTLESVVLGRPVHFQDFSSEADSKAEDVLIKAAKAIGFKNISFQFEPLAAAYAHESRLEKESLACVIDIGGGTSDFSVIRLGPDSAKKQNRNSDILANTGIRIGGNDFDKDLSIKCFMSEFGYGSLLEPDEYTQKVLPIPNYPYVMLSEWSSINSLYTYKESNNIDRLYQKSASQDKVKNLHEVVMREQGHILLNKVEMTKVLLTNNESVNADLDFLSQKPCINIEKSKFNDSIKNDTSKVISSMQECLKLSGVSCEDIDLVILTGGSTEIPYIKEEIKILFKGAIFSESDKISSVGLGLSYDAARRYG